MPTERPSFLDRVASAQKNLISNGEDRKITDLRRELTEIGVISAFQEIIDKKTTVKPAHTEYTTQPHLGYFLVLKDGGYHHTAEDQWDNSYTKYEREAIGIVKSESSYYVGCFKVDTIGESLKYSWGFTDRYHDKISFKAVGKNEIMDTLATVFAAYYHNLGEKGKENPNLLSFP